MRIETAKTIGGISVWCTDCAHGLGVYPTAAGVRAAISRHADNGCAEIGVESNVDYGEIANTIRITHGTTGPVMLVTEAQARQMIARLSAALLLREEARNKDAADLLRDTPLDDDEAECFDAAEDAARMARECRP